MRVLFVASAYARHADDVITPWFGALLGHLAQRGIASEVVAPAYRALASHEIEGIRIHRFRYAPSVLETLSHDAPIPSQIRRNPALLALVPGYLASAAAMTTRLARTRRFDLIHAFWPVPHALPSIVAKRATGIPLVSTFFGAELHWLSRSMPGGKSLTRFIVSQSDAVTAISAHTRDQLTRIAPDARPAVIPFGTTVDDRFPAPATRHGSGSRFVFVGRLVKRKGVDVLIVALSQLTDLGVTLTIVGDGPERTALTALAASHGVADRVTFTGFVPNERLAAEMSNADALVLPATSDESGPEGLGVVLIEALSLGTPVIATDTGGIPDIVGNEETGLLVPPGDATALADAMRRAVGNPSGMRAMAERGRRDVVVRFSWKRIVDDLLDVYRNAKGGRG